MRYHFTPIMMVIIKGWTIASVAKDVEKLELCILLVGTLNGTAAVENSLVSFSNSYRIAIQPSNSNPKYGTKRINRFQTKTWTQMFITALFTMAKVWKQAECLSSDEWISSVVCSYIILFSCKKKEEVLSMYV